MSEIEEYMRECVRLRAEIERMRGALEQLPNALGAYHTCGHHPHLGCAACTAAAVARAFLAPAEAPGHVQGCNGRGCSGECHREVGLQGLPAVSPDRAAALEAVAKAASPLRIIRDRGYTYSEIEAALRLQMDALSPAELTPVLRAIVDALDKLDRCVAPGKDGGSNG